jgi:hypothetical protein
VTADAGVMIARRDSGGMVTVPSRPYVVIPAAQRRRCGLRAGDHVLLAASPGQDMLAAYSFAVADQALRVSAAVSAGTRRAYGSYWNRVLEQWGDRRLDEPTPSEIRQLMAYVKTHVVARRNARGGRSAEEHLVAALRCLYQRAVDDGLIAEADNPARRVAKPRRLPTTRRALPDTRLAQINEVAASTGDDQAAGTSRLIEVRCLAAAPMRCPARVAAGRVAARPGRTARDSRVRRTAR